MIIKNYTSSSSITLILLGLFISSCVNKQPKDKSSENSRLIKMVYAKAVQGDVLSAIELLEAPTAASLSSKEKEVLKNYQHRFLNRDQPNFPSEIDSFSNQIIKVYCTYWARGLIKSMNESQSRSILYQNLLKVLPTKNAKIFSSKYNDENFSKLTAVLEKEFSDRGIYGLFGETVPFLELMLWRKQNEKSYQVQLHDKIQKVDVTFLTDFISMGWAFYATFGNSGTGGWATKEKLFCLKERYDLNSESFKVDYLGHEARHFADYRLYPKLKQPELEYRAKLTQLFQSQSHVKKILEGFENGQIKDRKYPHAFANFKVYTRIRNRLSKNEKVRLSEAQTEEIRKVAKELLVESSRILSSKGANTTEQFL